MKIRALLLLLAAALVVTGMWLTSRRGVRHVRHQEVPIQDGKTIDFSSGKPVVKDDAKEKAAIAKGIAEMDAAAANVTFTPKPPPPAAPAPQPTPAPAPTK